jgi:hypothetical protein
MMNAPTPRSEPEPVSNKRHAREQEGFARTLGPEDAAKGEALRCSTMVSCVPGQWSSDSRGWYPMPASLSRRHIEWETTPAETAERTVFTWMGGSRVWPAYTPAFPYATASISVDGGEPLPFPLGRPDGFRVERGDLVLEFEPRQYRSLVEGHHRVSEPTGISGYFRLHVGGKLLTAGKPLRLRIALDGVGDLMASLHVVPRGDCLVTDLRLLRDEVAMLQREVVTLKRSHEMLYAQQYPELFPERVRGERVIVTQDATKHLHPATLTVMQDGEVVVTMREGTDHLSRDGRIMITRSRDGGRTFGPREVMFDLGPVDHRSSPII